MLGFSMKTGPPPLREMSKTVLQIQASWKQDARSALFVRSRSGRETGDKRTAMHRRSLVKLFSELQLLRHWEQDAVDMRMLWRIASGWANARSATSLSARRQDEKKIPLWWLLERLMRTYCREDHRVREQAGGFVLCEKCRRLFCRSKRAGSGMPGQPFSGCYAAGGSRRAPRPKAGVALRPKAGACRLRVFLYCFGERRVVFVVKASAAARE